MNISRLSTLLLGLAIAVITLGLVAVPALADPAEDGCHVLHKACGDGGGIGGNRDETFYDVDIGILNETILGVSTRPWSTFGKGKSIGLGDGSLGHTGVGRFTDLTIFTSSDGPFGELDTDNITNGQKCFPSLPAVIHQGAVARGKHGQAEAGFFFEGFTHTKVEGEFVEINYGFRLTGDFVPDPWPPTDIDTPIMITMTAWELSATNEGKAIKDISCIGEGATNVTIIVTGPVSE